MPSENQGHDDQSDRLPDPAEADGQEAAERRDGAGRSLRDTALKLDRQAKLVEAARQLRRRLPGDDRFGDPLSTAGGTAPSLIARQVSALRPERESVLGELGFAGLQVWQSLSEATGRGRGEQELALLFTDLVGFSKWALRAGDAAALRLLREVGSAVETAIHAHDGRIVKRLGDGVMATFLDAYEAVEAALDAQAAVAEVDVDGYRPRMRAGVHWGRPRRLGGDLLGVDVNIAARVGDAARGEQVLVSDTALSRLRTAELSIGRQRRLRADGAPRDMHVAPVSRAA